MNAEIISVGTELLLGNIENTNTTYLSKKLAELGISVFYQSSVGDNAQRLIKLLSSAVERSQVIVITGGLGPTDDDITKETVCKALNIDLVLHEPTLRKIEEYFSRTGRQMTENNRKQAMIPQGAEIMENEHGTAPGIVLTSGEQVIMLLPGPPSEMRPMFEKYAPQFLSKYSDGIILSRTVKFIGIGESQLAEKIEDMFDGENPTVAPYAKTGEVHIRVTAKADNEKKAENLCEPPLSELRKRAGGYIYGYDDDTLESAVVTALKEKKLTVATAESCTAGLLSKRITDVPSSSQVFSMGVTTYSNEMKTELLGVPADVIEANGAVSPEVAREMAKLVKEKSGADLGIGITGIAGPDGGTDEKPVGLVYIAISDGEHTWVKKNIFGHGSDERDYIRYLATSTALNLIRLYMLFSGRLPGEGSDDMTEELEAAVSSFKIEKKNNFLKGIIPWKGDPPLEVVRKLVFLLSSCVLVFCILFFVNYFSDRQRSKDIISSTRALINSNTSSGEKEEGSDILKKYAELYAANNDVIGWLAIDGIETDNVVMKTGNNDYYLNHKITGEKLAEGELFVDCNNVITPDYQSKNITIYGHNRHDGQMFGQLNRYRTDVKPSSATTYGVEHYNLHNLVRFDTIYEEAVYKIFAVVYVNTKAEHDNGAAPFEYRQQDFSSDIEFLEFINQVRRRSFINTPVDVNADDHIINLSTCAYDIDEARLVIFARKVRPGESTEIDTSLVSVNKNILLPQAMYDKYPKRYGTTKPVFNDEAFATNIPSNYDPNQASGSSEDPNVSELLPPVPPVTSETATPPVSSQTVSSSRPAVSSRPSSSQAPSSTPSSSGAASSGITSSGAASSGESSSVLPSSSQTPSSAPPASSAPPEVSSENSSSGESSSEAPTASEDATSHETDTSSAA